jgi:hypothetical protein
MDTGISAGIVEKTASLTLTLVPRETTLDSLTKSSDYVNGTITAKYTPQNSAYYNQCSVYVKVNNTLTHIYTEKLDRKPSPYSIEFTSAQLSTIYSKVTNTATAVIYVKLQTFSDSGYKTKVGSDQAKEISLLLPTTVVPKATLTITPVNTNSWIAGKGIYVAGLSRATATLVAEPGAGLQNNAYTASITCNGVTSSGTKLDAILNQAGTIKFTGNVTDTRGRTATDTKNITVLSYSSPSVTSMTVERGELNGTSWETKATGTDVRVAFNTALALADKGNVYATKFEIDNGTKTPSNSTTSGLKTGTEYAAYFDNVDGDKSHTLKLTVTDSVGYAGVATITIPTTYITVEYKANGKGIAFGKTSEIDAFECAMPAVFSGTVNFTEAPCINGTSLDTILSQNASTINEDDGSVVIDGTSIDIIVAQGTSAMNHTVDGVTARSGTWTYRKWSSGIMECWGVANVNVNISMTWAAPYYYGVVSTVNYPVAFTELPVCNVSVAYGDDEKSLFIASCARGTKVYARGIMLCRNTTGEVNCDLHYHAIGKWK